MVDDDRRWRNGYGPSAIPKRRLSPARRRSTRLWPLKRCGLFRPKIPHRDLHWRGLYREPPCKPRAWRARGVALGLAPARFNSACPNSLADDPRYRPQRGDELSPRLRSVARKSGAIFWTELSPRCQPTLGGAAEDSTAIAVRKDGNLGRPHPR
jgi:hypothetical protein